MTRASENYQSSHKNSHSISNPACGLPSGNPAPPPRERFRRFASWTAQAAGSPWTFLAATLFLIVWAFSYPLFLAMPEPFNTWQLVVNTVTTIVTFLMVFLIQNTQNRDARAIHLKLDELIRAQKGARNHLVELEDCTDEELAQLKKEFERIHRAANGSHQIPVENEEVQGPRN